MKEEIIKSNIIETEKKSTLKNYIKYFGYYLSNNKKDR